MRHASGHKLQRLRLERPFCSFTLLFSEKGFNLQFKLMTILLREEMADSMDGFYLGAPVSSHSVSRQSS